MIKQLILILAIFIGMADAMAVARMASSTARGSSGSTAAAIRSVNAATNSATAANYNYNYMYPYLNNQMRTDLNPGTIPSQAGNPISVITRTEKLASDRRVVPRNNTRTRSATNTATPMAARNAITPQPQRASTTPSQARSATGTATPMAARSATGTSTRRVVARGAATNMRASAPNNRGGNTSASPVLTNTPVVTTARCLADYTQCMNDYCERENTAYNRCYCSARLAQIDAEYQPAIDKLIRQLLTLKSENHWTNAEMNEYWMDTIGKYTGSNSLENLDKALDINWADLESRVRGQKAFNTGHDYCVGHLRNCGSMASNLRDAYRSEIARDCETYETSLMRIKNAAESIIGNYSE